MNKPKVIFGVIMLGAFLMKAWWIFLPMLGFALGYMCRREVDRQAGKRNAS